MDHRMIMELAPFAMVICLTAIVFGYLTVRMLVQGRQPSKKERRKREKQTNLYNQETMEDLIDRAIDLAKRVQILEEIMHQERAKKE